MNNKRPTKTPALIIAVAFLFTLLVQAAVASAQNATNTTTTTVAAATNVTHQIAIFGETWEWIPPPGWEVVSTMGNCTFQPYKEGRLNDTYTQLTCRFPWNMTRDAGILDVIKYLLQNNDINTVADLKARLGKNQALVLYMGITITLIVVSVVLYEARMWYNSRSLQK